MAELLSREFSRKSFVKGGGAMLVGFSLAGAGNLPGKAQAATSPFASNGPYIRNAIDSWIVVHGDNTASIMSGRIEVGNGTPTGYLMIAAEELDMDVSQLKHVPPDTNVTPDTGANTADLGIIGVGPIVRGAAAHARQVLLGLAAVSLGVPAAGLTVKSGVVSGGGKSVTYGQLLGDKQFNVTMPVTPAAQRLTENGPVTNAESPLWPGQKPAKSTSQYRVVGTPVPRIDIPAKVAGTYTYVQNIKVPGMLHGRVVWQRGQGMYGTADRIVSVDEGSIKHIPGARVVRRADFLGVVAPTEYAAIQAASQLKVSWAERPVLAGHGNLWASMREQESAGLTTPVVTVNTGNVDSTIASAAHVVSASYAIPFGGHTPIGPACCVADVTPNGAVVYSGTYHAYNLRATLAPLLGLPANLIRVRYFEASSSHGGASLDNNDAPWAAAVMSQIVGKPVRLQLMRWDEHGYDTYESAQLFDIRGAVDEKGKIVAIDFVGHVIPATTSRGTVQQLVGGYPFAEPNPASIRSTGMMGSQYVIPNWRLVAKSHRQLNSGYPKLGIVRGVQYFGQGFAQLQMFDELAHAANMDPAAFNRLNVSTSSTSRWLAVLDAVTKAANWQPKVAASNLSSANVVTGRGLSFGGKAETSNVPNGPGLDAVVADIEVNKTTGKIVVKHLYTAHDYGLIIGPDLVENSTEGQVMMAVSRLLNEQVRMDKHAVTSLDWVSYPILRFKDHPTITNVAINRPELLSSAAGEELMPPTAAAIANAFFDATGVRIRQGPLTPARVRATLAAAKAGTYR